MKIPHNSKLLVYAIIGLAILAIILGGFILKNKIGTTNGETEFAVETTPPELLNPPPQNAPETEKQRHYALAVNSARDTKELIIENCFGNPAVARIKMGESLALVNKDETDHVLVLDSEHVFPASAKKIDKIEINEKNFRFGPGLYGYGCDQNQGTRGFILVAPN